MQMPNNYESTKVGGDFTPVNLGGHHMVIKQVAERKNKKGGDMIVVLFDFAANDSQPGYFTEAFRDDVRPDKKWSHNGTAYINVNDQNGQCSRSFKGFITSCEKSNKFTAAWGENFCAQFKGKKIGGIFGEVENEYNGCEINADKNGYFYINEASEKVYCKFKGWTDEDKTLIIDFWYDSSTNYFVPMVVEVTKK